MRKEMANVTASAAAARPCPFNFSRHRKRAAVTLGAVVSPDFGR
jgi:hypothetical protein